MYTSYFVLFGHFFYHAYVAGTGEQGIKAKVLQEGVTIISAGTDNTIMKSSNGDIEDKSLKKVMNGSISR
jgi:hypothetical protein